MKLSEYLRTQNKNRVYYYQGTIYGDEEFSITASQLADIIEEEDWLNGKFDELSQDKSEFYCLDGNIYYKDELVFINQGVFDE